MDIFYFGYYRKELALYLESKLGASPEQIILIFTIIMTIPFSFLNYFIHSKTNRLLYSFLIGFLFQYSIFGINMLHTIFSTISTYLFVYFLGRKISPFYLLIGIMIHLSYLHIYRMIVDYGGWTVDDITTIYMISVTKYSSFAFSFADGNIDPKNIKSEHHKAYRIEKTPSFLEFASYIYFYPTSIAGPFIEFKDFINFIEEKDCYNSLNNKFCFLFVEGLKKFFAGIFFIAFYAIIGARYPISPVGTSQFRIDYPIWWKRILYLYIAGPVARSKYYIAWLLCYSSLIFSGMAYGEIKKEDKIIKNVEKGSYGSILFNEFGMHPKYKMIHWNRPIHIWLKYNVYTRLLNPLNKNIVLASFITYIFSSIWHGFYPSYYLNFFLIYLFEQNSLFLDRFGFYKFVDENKIMWPLVSLKSTFFNDSIGAFFYCLESGAVKQIMINFYGLPVYVTIGFFIFTVIYNIFFGEKKIKKIAQENSIDKEKVEKKIEKEKKQ